MGLPHISTRKGKVLAGAAVGLLCWAAVFALYAAGLLEFYELKTYDQLCRLNAGPAPSDIVEVVVDQGSLEAAKKQGINWPWPRQMYAPIVQFCARGGARAVAFDVLFTEPSAYGVEDDQVFAEAIEESGRTILPVFLSRDDRPQAAWELALLARVSLRIEDRTGQDLSRDENAVLPNRTRNPASPDRPTTVPIEGRTREGTPPHRSLTAPIEGQTEEAAQPHPSDAFSIRPLAERHAPSPYRSAVLPIQPLAEQVAGLGNVAIPPDPDGIYRRLPPVFFFQGDWIPSLGMAVHDLLAERKPYVLSEAGLTSAGTRIPLDAAGNFLLTYYAAEPGFGSFSAFNVIQSFQALQDGGEPLYPPGAFRDKIVFVGFTAAGLFDLKSTPISSINPGTAIHATLVANLLRREFRQRIPAALLLALAALLALSVGVAVMLIPSLGRLALLLAASAGGLVLVVAAAFRLGLWVDGVFPFTSLILSFALANAFSYATEGRQRRQIKQMFSHYMSDLLIQDLLKNPDKLRLGGERRVLTVFFSDLAGFTSLSEKLSPEEVVSILNRYLTAMTEIILESGGLIDKYEGDAIMAFWGAPVPQEDHAARACLAALDNQARLAELRRDFEREGLPAVRARIGLNTGEMIIGNMGSSQRFDFTVIGDSVNLASRLEGAGKEYGVGILISEDTFHMAASRVEARELDLLRVKGKDTPVRIYELLARKGGLDDRRQRVCELFNRGLEAYRERHWAEAVTCFEQVLALDPGDGPARTYVGRCRQFQEAPPPDDWDGVYRLTSK